MQRLTQKTETGGYEALAGTSPAALATRLALYETFHETLLQKEETLGGELEQLRSSGKKNSARFKEKLGEKLMVSNTLLLLKMQGIE